MGEFLGKEQMGDTTEGSSIAAQSAQDDPTETQCKLESSHHP